MSHKRAIVLFVAGACLLAAAGGVFETTFNNYLRYTFEITPEQRGFLELPREFPGFMVAVLTGVLFFAAESHLAILAASLIAAGMFGLAAFAKEQHEYLQMLVFIIVWSTGAHLMMPTSQSIALSLVGPGRTGEDLGRLGAVTAMATILGCGLVWLNFTVFPTGYSLAFLIGSGVAIAAAMAFTRLQRVIPPIHHGRRPKFVFRRRYWLFYVLSVLFGARKQVFITFGPWMLIVILNQPPQTIAKLWMTSMALQVVLVPWVGRMVDRVGERLVLMADALLLLCVCLTYGFARDFLPEGYALLAVCGAFVVDQLLFPVQMARTVYLSRMAQDRRDVTASLGLSTSVDHAVSIPIAMLGGILWQTMGYRWVFVAAGGVAVLTFAACNLIPAGPAARAEGPGVRAEP